MEFPFYDEYIVIDEAMNDAIFVIICMVKEVRLKIQKINITLRYFKIHCTMIKNL